MTQLAEAILNKLPYHIVWKSSEGIFLGCNTSFLKLAGFKKVSDVIGKSDYDMPWKAHAAKFMRDDEDVMRDGFPKTDYEESHIVEGKQRWFRVSKSPLELTEGKRGLLCVFADITEIKDAASALSREKLLHNECARIKKDFLQQLCHDLKTPLCSIVGVVDKALCENTDDAMSFQRSMEDISVSSKHMLNMIHNFMEHGELSSNQMPIQKLHLIVDERLEDLYLIFKLLLKERGNHLVVENTVSGIDVLTDVYRFSVILNNLVGNACKFTKDGVVSVSVSIQEREGQSWLHLEVKDTGIGISKSNVKVIFQAYRKVRPSYKTGIYQGSGLGLSVVKRYVHDLDGEVTVSSVPGEGSTFHCSWPVKVREHLELCKSLREEKCMKVLCVEDVESIMCVHVRMLEALNCKVYKAYSSAEALKVVDGLEGALDLCLVDLGLPDKDGHELALDLRSRLCQPNCKLVCVSAHRLDEQHLLSKTFDFFIQKPCQLSDLKLLLQE